MIILCVYNFLSTNLIRIFYNRKYFTPNFLIKLGLVVKPLTIFFLLNFFIKFNSAMSQNIFVVINFKGF